MTWNPRANELFLAARELSAADRPALLDRECNGDTVLWAEVEALLAADVGAGGSLERPAGAPGATEVYTPAADRPGDVIGRYKLLQVIGKGGMTWSPDGAYLAYAERVIGGNRTTYNIRRVPAAGGSSTSLTSDGNSSMTRWRP